MIIHFKKLHPDAVLPSYAHQGDAAMDLTTINDGETIAVHGAYEFIEYRFGFAVEIPDGHVGLVFPRSSQSLTGLVLANCVGVIDSGYRGEVKARFKVEPGQRDVYSKGDRIAQLIIMPYPKAEPLWVEKLSDTSRGTGAFGSTNK